MAEERVQGLWNLDIFQFYIINLPGMVIGGWVYILQNCITDKYTIGLGNAFNPAGNIDIITKEITFFPYGITRMNSQADMNPFILPGKGVSLF